MEKRTFGNTGLSVTVLGYGTIHRQFGRVECTAETVADQARPARKTVPHAGRVGTHSPAIPGLEDARRFQMFTLDYGRAFYAFNSAWYQNLLETLKKDIP
jgi:hypothetical protein